MASSAVRVPKLLATLRLYAGVSLPRSFLADVVWEGALPPMSRAVDVAVGVARGELTDGEKIESTLGGYRYTASTKGADTW